VSSTPFSSMVPSSRSQESAQYCKQLRSINQLMRIWIPALFFWTQDCAGANRSKAWIRFVFGNRRWPV
jgi:hypothetical protein